MCAECYVNVRGVNVNVNVNVNVDVDKDVVDRWCSVGVGVAYVGRRTLL